MSLYDKINQAKCGKTVTIYPDELHDLYFPVVAEDTQNMCTSLNLTYTFTNGEPPTITISNPTPSTDNYFPDDFEPEF